MRNEIRPPKIAQERLFYECLFSPKSQQELVILSSGLCPIYELRKDSDHCSVVPFSKSSDLMNTSP